ncbi:MAG: DMT family transporter [Pseudomonadota bacterium]
MMRSRVQQRPSLLASGLLLVMGMMWGLQFAMLKLAARGGYSEPAVLLIALVLLSIAFTALLLLRGARLRLDARLLVFLLMIATLGYVIPLIATLATVPVLSAGVLSLVACLSPVAALFASVLMRTEHVAPRRVVAVALGLVSVALLLVPELVLPEGGRTFWILVALLVPLCYGIESVYIARHWPGGMSPLQVVTAQTIAATLIVAPLCLIWAGPFPSLGPDGPGLPELGIAIFVIAGVVESLIYLWLIRHTGGVFVNFGTFISLFAGIAWGIVLFGEAHPATTWLAVAVLVLALGLAGQGSAGTSTSKRP